MILSVSLRWTAIGVFYATCIQIVSVDWEIIAMNIFHVNFFHVKFFSRTSKPIAKFFSLEIFIPWKNILR